MLKYLIDRFNKIGSPLSPQVHFHTAATRNFPLGNDYVSAVKLYCDKHGLKPEYAVSTGGTGKIMYDRFTVRMVLILPWFWSQFFYVEDPRNPHFVAELTLKSGEMAIEHLRVKGHGRNKRTAKHVVSKEMLRMLGEPINN